MNCLPDSSSDLPALTPDSLGSSHQDIIAELGILSPLPAASSPNRLLIIPHFPLGSHFAALTLMLPGICVQETPPELFTITATHVMIYFMLFHHQRTHARVFFISVSSLTCLYSSESHLVSSCFLLVFLHHSTLMVILLPKRFVKGFLLNNAVYHHSHSGPYCFSLGLLWGLLTSFYGLNLMPLNVIFQPGARLVFLNGLSVLIIVYKHLSKVPYYLQ